MWQEPYFIHLIPGGIKVLVYGLAREGFTPNADLHVGVALAFHYAAQSIVFGNKILTCQQVNPKKTLNEILKKNILIHLSQLCFVLNIDSILFSLPLITSVAKLGWGEDFWGSAFFIPAATVDDTSALIFSSSNHKT